MSKKILIVTECFYPEEFKINDVALEWKKKGYEVGVLTMVPSYPVSQVFDGYENKWYQKDSWNGITIYRVKAVTGYKTSLFKKLLKYFAFMFTGSIVSLFIGKKYDYIFGFNMSALTGMMPAVIIKKLYNKPLTFWAQDIWPDSVYAYGFKKTKLLSYCLNKFVGFMHRSVDNIAISGKGFENKLKPYCNSNQLFHYLPNWADNLDMSMEPFKFSDDEKINFTFAGNIGKVQNLENIIKAYSALENEYLQKSQLNIIGDGSALEDLKILGSENKSIIFHGKKPRKDMAMYYKGSDFLIVSLIDKPIFSVTVPSKTQTYIAAKKPILAIINGDTSNIIKENNLGFTAHPNDMNEITNIFVQAINSTDEKRSEFIKNSEILTSTVFNQDKIIDKLLELTISKE
ncbi:MAG: glycosyltransferase family 4 protein [Arcobacter sp.]|uniref:glycosyltransferase family 4 protein n=1 Tax=Arcobacter sp. TaxID=1872629 RepID=UPI003D017D26